MKDNKSKYKVSTLLNSIISIQAMEPDLAKAYLKSMALKSTTEVHFYCLCRLLFTKSGSSWLRAPLLGNPDYLNGTDEVDWPLTPVELIEGIPFLVVKGYALKGTPESPAAYLDYCIEHGKWNRFRFKQPTGEEKQLALIKLISSKKLTGKLSKEEQQFLQNQL